MMLLIIAGSAAWPPLWPGSMPMVWPASAVAAEPGSACWPAGWRVPVVALGTGEAVCGAAPDAWPALHPAIAAAPTLATISRPAIRPRRPVSCPCWPVTNASARMPPPSAGGGSAYGVFRTKYRYGVVASMCPREPSGQHAVPSTEPPQGMRWQRGEPSCAPGHGCEPRTDSATAGRGWNLRPSRAERMSRLFPSGREARVCGMRAANSLAPQPAPGRSATLSGTGTQPVAQSAGQSRVGNAAEAGAAADDWSGCVGLLAGGWFLVSRARGEGHGGGVGLAGLVRPADGDLVARGQARRGGGRAGHDP